jgi:DNA primase
MCHNPSCSANSGGSLERFVALKSGKSPVEAVRFIAAQRAGSVSDLSSIVSSLTEDRPVRLVPQEKLDELRDAYLSSSRAQEYMASRGFDDETTEIFEVGYDRGMDMVIVPIHNAKGEPIGVNGRSIEGKRFKLTRSLERNSVLFNLHRARRQGGTAIVFESQFDVMKAHQSGFPNGICFFGSHISKEQAGSLQRNFDRVIIMTDADEAGRKAGHNLSAMLRNTAVEWAIWDWGVIYPDGAKDAGDMTEEQIRHCINNAVSDVAYKSYRQLAKR